MSNPKSKTRRRSVHAPSKLIVEPSNQITEGFNSKMLYTCWLVAITIVQLASTPTGAATSSSSSPQQLQQMERQPKLPPESKQATNSNNNNNNNNLLVSHKSPSHSRQFGDTINDIQIECNSDNIVVTLTTNQGFNGMIYPKGLSKNSTCMMEYHQMTSNITYYLPLKSCNTMSSDVEDGIEYFNTVMVQPHRRLVTNQGRGYHIRCRYQTKERTITNQEQQLSVNLTHSTPSVVGSVSMPTCQMRIYSANDLSHEVAAENVKIGDELHLVISLDDQDVYGMLVTNCLVRDGMNWGEQPLLDDNGCPIDEDIMPQFVYAHNLTRASVTFQAHKFPYTSSVYYQCNVRLCFRESGCNNVPPNCGGSVSGSGFESSRIRDTAGHYQRSAGDNNNRNELAGSRRHRRWIDAGEVDGFASEDVLRANSDVDIKAMNIEVFSGLHVRETEPIGASTNKSLLVDDLADAGDSREPVPVPVIMAAASTSHNGAYDAEYTLNSFSDSGKGSGKGGKQQQQQESDSDLCMPVKKLATIVALIGFLVIAIIIMVSACVLRRRKRRRQMEQVRAFAAAQQATIYDNQQYDPYLNRGYMRE